ncbi:uncharacterized protein YkwD [Streptacidiphilus sp. MAP12-33]|uniref:CAP domain-containing protein n=1 Tax=Streptacidiphilus sp. MAP12-33 TaxID=3156266 RepID=UPI003517C927
MATAAAAGVGVVLSGALPMPPGMSPGVTVAGDPAGAVGTPTATASSTRARPVPIGAHPTGSRPSTPAVPTATWSVSSTPTSAPPSTSPSATASASVSASPSVSASVSAGTGTDEAAVLALVNTARAQHGCGALSASPALTELAQSFSREMAARGFFSHTDPDGHTPWDRARALGITNLGGENIARGQQTPDAVMTAWLNSPGHRANILDCAYHSLGVGVFYGAGGPWWTQDFGF